MESNNPFGSVATEESNQLQTEAEGDNPSPNNERRISVGLSAVKQASSLTILNLGT